LAVIGETVTDLLEPFPLTMIVDQLHAIQFRDIEEPPAGNDPASTPQ
jgi:hypothetical protein